MIIYQCEDSMESIFTAVYRAYEEKHRPEDTMVSLTDESFLFAEYASVQADAERAQKVARTLLRDFGEEDYFQICMALAAADSEKGQAVYRTIAAGLRNKCRKGHLFDDLKDDHVRKAFILARRAKRELEHQKQFLRFQEVEPALENDKGERGALVSRADSGRRILYARINPQCQVINFLMEHFADRFPKENFMIYDECRKIMGVHPIELSGKQTKDRFIQTEQDGGVLPQSITWYLVRCKEDFAAEDKLRKSDREMAYQELFSYFCHKIAIKERRNLELQRNMLPLRFREYMTEFQRLL